MAKIISRRLLKPGIDKLPSGPTMFSRRSWSESEKSSQTSTAGTPESATADPETPQDSRPDALVLSVMKRHGFTREEAEQAIRDTGVY